MQIRSSAQSLEKENIKVYGWSFRGLNIWFSCIHHLINYFKHVNFSYLRLAADQSANGEDSELDSNDMIACHWDWSGLFVGKNSLFPFIVKAVKQ